MDAAPSFARTPPSRPGLCQSRIPEDRKERSAPAVRKRIGPALAVVDDESLDGHGLHCVRGDANSGMADAGCGALMPAAGGHVAGIGKSFERRRTQSANLCYSSAHGHKTETR